ncbi:MAG: hypothetical protein ACTTGW_01345 [Candidatus Cryptobacteroides sp.]
MKSARQIEEWLSGQEWYQMFCDNRDEQAEYGRYFEGLTSEAERRAKVISNAFDWHHTPEGFEFWSEKNREYLKWLTDGDFMAEASLVSHLTNY